MYQTYPEVAILTRLRLSTMTGSLAAGSDRSAGLLTRWPGLSRLSIVRGALVARVGLG